jgi:biopolymer transport protein ExbD
MSTKRFDQINMIPFIDIMLVLLAIVLTTASFISQGMIPVDLPKAEQAQAPSDSDEKTLEITINANNALFFDGQAIKPEELASKLEAKTNTTPILLRVDKAAAFEYFIQALDVVKAKQFNNVSIQTEPAP